MNTANKNSEKMNIENLGSAMGAIRKIKGFDSNLNINANVEKFLNLANNIITRSKNSLFEKESNQKHNYKAHSSLLSILKGIGNLNGKDFKEIPILQNLSKVIKQHQANTSTLTASIRALRNFHPEDNVPAEYLSTIHDKFSNLKNHDFKGGETIMMLQGVRNLDPELIIPEFTNKVNSWIDTMIINTKNLGTIGLSMRNNKSVSPEFLENLQQK